MIHHLTGCEKQDTRVTERKNTTNVKRINIMRYERKHEKSSDYSPGEVITEIQLKFQCKESRRMVNKNSTM
jgi:hypothetical protein